MLSFYLVLGSAWLSLSYAQNTGNITCANDSLDWYTVSVGVTPCRTYELLRQSCNPNFRVGILNSSMPADICSDQLPTCCCNSVAFGLSMLCLNCQLGRGSTPNGNVGIDAPGGTYQAYLGTCRPSTNASLPEITQKAMCEQNVTLPKYLYRPFWRGGAWFYEYIKQSAQVQINSGFNHTNLCGFNDQDSDPSLGDPQPAGGENIKGIAIVGGVMGAVILILGAGLIWSYLHIRKLQERNGLQRRNLEDDSHDSSSFLIEPPSVVPTIRFIERTDVVNAQPAVEPSARPNLLVSRPVKTPLPAPRNLRDHVSYGLGSTNAPDRRSSWPDAAATEGSPSMIREQDPPSYARY